MIELANDLLADLKTPQKVHIASNSNQGENLIHHFILAPQIKE